MKSPFMLVRRTRNVRASRPIEYGRFTLIEAASMRNSGSTLSRRITRQPECCSHPNCTTKCCSGFTGQDEICTTRIVQDEFETDFALLLFRIWTSRTRNQRFDRSRPIFAPLDSCIPRLASATGTARYPPIQIHFLSL